MSTNIPAQGPIADLDGEGGDAVAKRQRPVGRSAGSRSLPRTARVVGDLVFYGKATRNSNAERVRGCGQWRSPEARELPSLHARQTGW